MENKEAIEMLERFQNPEPWEPQITNRAYEALEMAIAALQKQETAKIVVGKSKGGVTLWNECSKCGELIDAKDIFCRRCGRKLTRAVDESDGKRKE